MRRGFFIAIYTLLAIVILIVAEVLPPPGRLGVRVMAAGLLALAAAWQAGLLAKRS